MSGQEVRCPWCLKPFRWPHDVIYFVPPERRTDGETIPEWFVDGAYVQALDAEQYNGLLARGARPACPRSPRYRAWREQLDPEPPAPSRSSPAPDAATETDLGTTRVHGSSGVDTAEIVPGAEQPSFLPLPVVAAEPAPPPPPESVRRRDGRDPRVPAPDDLVDLATAVYKTSDSFEGLHELPEGYGDNALVIVALAGDSTVGKSHYFTALWHQLTTQHRELRRLGFEFTFSLDSLEESFRTTEVEAFVNPPHRAIPPTLQGRARMLLLRMRVTTPTGAEAETRPAAQIVRAVQGVLGTVGETAGDREAEVNVLLVDLPGEAFASRGSALRWNRVLAIADAVLYLQDPADIAALHREISGEHVPDGSKTVKVVDMVRAVVQSRDTGPPRTRSQMAALVLTKSDQLDVLRGRMGDMVVAKRVAGTHELVLNESAVQGASADVYALLHAFGGEAAAAKVVQAYGASSLHVVSAAGCGSKAQLMGDEGGVVVQEHLFRFFRPRNVLHPLLTLLWQWAVAQEEQR